MGLVPLHDVLLEALDLVQLLLELPHEGEAEAEMEDHSERAFDRGADTEHVGVLLPAGRPSVMHSNRVTAELAEHDVADQRLCLAPRAIHLRREVREPESVAHHYPVAVAPATGFRRGPGGWRHLDPTPSCFLAGVDASYHGHHDRFRRSPTLGGST